MARFTPYHIPHSHRARADAEESPSDSGASASPSRSQSPAAASGWSSAPTQSETTQPPIQAGAPRAEAALPTHARTPRRTVPRRVVGSSKSDTGPDSQRSGSGSQSSASESWSLASPPTQSQSGALPAPAPDQTLSTPSSLFQSQPTASSRAQLARTSTVATIPDADDSTFRAYPLGMPATQGTSRSTISTASTHSFMSMCARGCGQPLDMPWPAQLGTMSALFEQYRDCLSPSQEETPESNSDAMVAHNQSQTRDGAGDTTLRLERASDAEIEALRAEVVSLREQRDAALADAAVARETAKLEHETTEHERENAERERHALENTVDHLQAELATAAAEVAKLQQARMDLEKERLARMVAEKSLWDALQGVLDARAEYESREKQL